MRNSLLVVFILFLVPFAASQPTPPRPMPVDREALITEENQVPWSGTIGDFEITVHGQDQSPPSNAGGINTSISFTVTYIGATFGNPGTTLEFFAHGATDLIYDRTSFGCEGTMSEIDERLFTGGSIETSICFTVHPDDADVISLGVATKSGDDEPIWLATTDHSTSGTPIVAAPVFIIMQDSFTFEPDSITIPANTNVSFTLASEGFMQHGFEIADTDYEIDLLNNSESTTLIVNLPPGTYTFICPVAGHEQSGMVGTITVEDSNPRATPDALEELVVSDKVAVTTFDDFTFSPDSITIPANVDVQITVTNEGFMQHDFVIQDTGYSTQLLNNGKSEDLVVNLPPGSYRFICTVAGHEQAGMVGTLIVE